MKIKNQKINYDRGFFETPNLRNSYWAGFAGADGCIPRKTSLSGKERLEGLSFTLSTKDENHLNQLKTDIGYEGSIKYIDKTTYETSSPQCYLALWSKQIADDLNKNWLLTPNKTFTLKFPSHLANDLKFSYVIGYIDGDGSCHVRDGLVYRISILGNLEFCTELRSFLTEYLVLQDNDIKLYKHKNIYELSIGHREILHKFRKQLLEIHYEIPLLSRKWDKVLNNQLFQSRFFNGSSCSIKEHGTLKYKGNEECVKCTDELIQNLDNFQKSYYIKNQKTKLEYAEKYRQDNLELLRAKNRESYAKRVGTRKNNSKYFEVVK